VSLLMPEITARLQVDIRYSVLQCVAVCCGVLRCVAVAREDLRGNDL